VRTAFKKLLAAIKKNSFREADSPKRSPRFSILHCQFSISPNSLTSARQYFHFSLLTSHFPLFTFLFSIFLLSSCEKDITINLPPSEKLLVVEGHIQTGQSPYVILSRNSDYYSSFTLDSLNNFFVHNAIVKVSNGTDTVTMTELSLDTMDISVSAYVGLGMIGEEGKTYSLTIEAEGEKLTSVTTIPFRVPLDSLWYQTDVYPDNDSLVRLMCRYTDPPQLGQYVRYFTKVNNEPYWPGLNSVFTDDVVNGTTFDFPLDRGVDRSNDSTFEYYGLFRKGDTITVNWSNIDKAHYDFWRTLEFELGSQGSPFSSPIEIQGNIVGGLGIWGGYSPSYKTLIVPK